ncbi:MAG: GNAT family N-acetyltransferase [Acidiphilium sp.]
MTGIDTEHLRCEPLSIAHADAMLPVLADPMIYQFTPDGPPPDIGYLRKRYAILAGGRNASGTETWLNWILILRTTNLPIGYVQATIRSRRCSFAYILNSEHWGLRLAGEACRAIISHLFQAYELDAIEAEIDQRNTRSIRLAERLGFCRIGHDGGDFLFRLERQDG